MGDIKKWPSFNLISPKFLSTIKIAFVYGANVSNTLIVTHSDMVYQLTYKTQSNLKTTGSRFTIYPIKIDSLCNLHIKTIACSKMSNMLILTEDGKVYSIKKALFNTSGYIMKGSIPNIRNDEFNNEFIQDIACGSHHFLVLTFHGKIYQLVSDDLSSSHYSKVATSLKQGIVDMKEKVGGISCGHNYNVIVTANEEVYSWGDNDYGQLGHGDVEFRCTPCKVEGLTGVAIKKVACGYDHVLALSTKGDLYAWGANKNGQLSGFNHDSVHVPIKVPLKEMVVDIATTFHHNISIAMGRDNRVFVWGKCLNFIVIDPILTPVKSIHDAFAYYGLPRVMHQPLILPKQNKNCVLYSLQCAFNDEVTSDLIIHVDGFCIYVHKIILMIRCKYFKVLFQENHEIKNQSVIKENKYSYNVYKAFLQYLYTGEIDVSEKDMLEFLKLTNDYSMNRLKRRWMKCIRKYITTKNVISIYIEAIKSNAKEVEDSCIRIIFKNMTEVLQSPDFAELDITEMRKIVIEAAKAGLFRT